MIGGRRHPRSNSFEYVLASVDGRRLPAANRDHQPAVIAHLAGHQRGYAEPGQTPPYQFPHGHDVP